MATGKGPNFQAIVCITQGRGDLPQIQVLPARKYHSKSAMVAMLFGSLSATETIHSRIRLTKTPHPHQPPTSRPALTKTQPQPQRLNQFSSFVLRRAKRGRARVQPPHGHSPGPVSTSPRSKPASTSHPQHFLVSGPHQNPCTPAHRSPKPFTPINHQPTRLQASRMRQRLGH